MPFQQVHLTTGTCEEPPINIDSHVVRLQPDVDLKVHNNLAGNVDAVMQFFNLYDKGGSPIGGFCDGMNGVDFQVPGTGTPPTCEPTTTGAFTFTVTANDHQDLDPVLIIEPAASAAYMRHAYDFGPYDAGGAAFGLLPLLATAALTAVVGFGVGRFSKA